LKICLHTVVYSLAFILLCGSAKAHEVTFCGHGIPLSEDFIANKLMDVIRAQMPTANLPALKQKTKVWFPYIEKCLKKYGLPEDLKYLPIVESGFSNRQSSAGANGFWQLMPETARDYNLMVNQYLDERLLPAKSTEAACQILRDYHNKIKSDTRQDSWVLTAAAYNWGIGNVIGAIKKQGGNYFAMHLNAETAEYVYKIIAVKELFENPEIYMKGFDRNVFSTSYTEAETIPSPAVVSKEFETIKISEENNVTEVKKEKQIYYISAHIIPNEDRFRDGKMITIELDGDLELPTTVKRKGSELRGTGWVIDERVYVNLGYGHAVQVMDKLGTKGIQKDEIDKEKNKVLLKVETY
jgi:membrane-bound lytic murein transglycosylase D